MTDQDKSVLSSRKQDNSGNQDISCRFEEEEVIVSEAAEVLLTERFEEGKDTTKIPIEHGPDKTGNDDDEKQQVAGPPSSAEPL